MNDTLKFILHTLPTSPTTRNLKLAITPEEASLFFVAKCMHSVNMARVIINYILQYTSCLNACVTCRQHDDQDSTDDSLENSINDLDLTTLTQLQENIVCNNVLILCL